MTPMKRLSAAAAGVALALTATLVSAPAAQAGSSYDLAGLWLFNEPSGQKAYDLSFHGNTGQLGSTSSVDANDPERLDLGRWWWHRGALRFAGDDYVKVNDDTSLEPDGVTVVARVRATSPGNYRYVVAKGAWECWTASYGLYTGGDGGLRFYVSDGLNYTMSNDAGAGLWDGRWHTVVGAYDGTRVRLWVDGSQVGEPVPTDIAVSYGLRTDDNFYIGTYAGDCTGQIDPGFRGDIDGVALIGHSAGRAMADLVE